MLKKILPFGLAFAANFILGASSIYWHLFQSVSSTVLVSFRVLFSLVFLAIIVTAFSGIRQLVATLTMRLVLLHIFAALVVSINWGTFIWASLNGAVLESGLGYLVAPLVTMSVGVVFFKEAATWEKRLGIGAICLTLGILVQQSGQLVHWVYWIIGLTWGAYTLLKKQTSLNSVDGLFVETGALAAVILVASQFPLVKPHVLQWEALSVHPLLYFCGIVSVTPLLMFSYAARRLDTYSMGGLQFVLPTTQLLVSLIYFGEKHSAATYICFGTIWLVLALAIAIDHRRKPLPSARTQATKKTRNAGAAYDNS